MAGISTTSWPRHADVVGEWVGSLYGWTAAAVRGLRRPRHGRSLVIEGPQDRAVLRLHASRLGGLDTIGAQLLTGRYEPTTQRLMRHLIRPGATVVDVGANIGFFTVLGAVLTGPRGRVLAFEPEPRNHGQLARNVLANGLRQVEVHARACSDRPGRHFLDVNHAESGWHRLAPAGATGAGRRRVPVELVTLDSVVGSARVDLVKIDVEGHEGSVVAGMMATVRANPDLVVVLEHSPSQARLAGLDPMAPLHALVGAGLTCVHVVRESEGRLDRVDLASLGSRDVLGGARSVNLVLSARPPQTPLVRATIADR